MSEVVRPEGWQNWDTTERESPVRSGPSGSKGPGGKIDRRVAWANRAVPRGARTVTVTTVLGGPDRWNPATVPAHPSRVRALDTPLPDPPASK